MAIGRGRLLRVGFVLSVWTVVSCGGGSSPPPMLPMPPSASITPSASGTGADFVRVISGASNGDVVTLEVAIGGPTTSSDIYAFAFDLVLGNPALVELLPGSALAGSALTNVGCAGNSEVLVTLVGDRIVVGVTKLGACNGNGIPAGETAIVSLTFRVTAVGSSTVTLAGSPGNPQNPAMNPTAFDSSGSVIGSISFDTAAATIRGM